LRGDLPFGYVKAGTETYISTNGSKIGTCLTDASYGKCFEVSDYIKGDLARTYFYLVTAYWEEWTCCTGPGFDKSNIAPAMEADLRAWNMFDPVD